MMQHMFKQFTKLAIILSVTIAGAMTLSVPHANAASVLSPVIDPVMSLLTPPTTNTPITSPTVAPSTITPATTPTSTNPTTSPASPDATVSTTPQATTQTNKNFDIVPASNTVTVDPFTSSAKSVIAPTSFALQTTPAVYTQKTTDGFSKLTAMQKSLGGLSALVALIVGAVLLSFSQINPAQKLSSLFIGVKA